MKPCLANSPHTPSNASPPEAIATPRHPACTMIVLSRLPSPGTPPVTVRFPSPSPDSLSCILSVFSASVRSLPVGLWFNAFSLVPCLTSSLLCAFVSLRPCDKFFSVPLSLCSSVISSFCSPHHPLNIILATIQPHFRLHSEIG